MQQFNLDTWLKDKSRKVVTRRGNPVRIICTDRKHGEDDLPIVFLEQCHNGEFLLACRKDGRSDAYDTPYDLFFADEENTELTEFDYAVLSIISDHNSHTDSIEAFAKRSSKKLLDLARKEILKDLPKWRKATKCKDFNKYVCVMDYYTFPFLDTEVNEGDYYIKLEDLKTLPKEE